MKIYQITKYDKSDRLLFWHCFFRRSALRKAARIASDFTGKDVGESDGAIARFVNPNAPEYLVTVLCAPLVFCEPWKAVRRWFRKRGHAQNLNRDKRDKVKGSILRHGRCWYRPYGYEVDNRIELSAEWLFFCHGGKKLALGVSCFGGDSDNNLSFNCSFLFGRLYLTIENFFSRKQADKHQWEHNTGFYWFEGSLRFEIWHAGDDCYECKTWKGWSKHIFVREAILGKTKYASRVLDSADVLVPMPEAEYPAKVEIREDSWTHSRWPFSRKLLRAHIEIEKGIPVPGKGENSWDCGEDGIYGLTCQAVSVSDAISKVQKSAIETRERYGGKNWRPQAA